MKADILHETGESAGKRCKSDGQKCSVLEEEFGVSDESKHHS